MYNFDNVAGLGETTGIVKDLSQYGNNGSGYGSLVWTSNGRRNGAYNFNGSNTYISPTSQINLNITGSITISLWINSTNIAPEQAVLWKAATMGNPDYGIEIY